MPNWHNVLSELNQIGSQFDVLRRQYLRRLANYTKRNVICYYSGWLQKKGLDGLSVNDSDKNGLMTVINKLDVRKGLDLILHTPGGDTAATESIVDYLNKKFGNNIRCFVPQMAMSAGTMIACSCNEIWMGKQSSLGPIDPQFGAGIPAHAILEEFERAKSEIIADPRLIPVWQPIIAKYSPTLLGECKKAIEWSNSMAETWLRRNMLNDDPDVDEKVSTILTELGDHSVNYAHNRHLSAEKCKTIGLKIRDLEDDQRLQDAILSVHHTFIHTLSSTPAIKIIENHNGVAFIQAHQLMMLQQGMKVQSLQPCLDGNNGALVGEIPPTQSE